MQKIEIFDNNFLNNIQLSERLLSNNDLLTPMLENEFGKMVAKESTELECLESASTYLRESSLIQQCSGSKILEATLRIIKSTLPDGFITDLKESDSLFGSLLLKYQINSFISNPKMIIRMDINDGSLRVGRTHTINCRNTDRVICYVMELLVPEEQLLLAKESVETSCDNSPIYSVA